MTDCPETEFDLDYPDPADDEAALMALEIRDEEARPEPPAEATDPNACVAEFIGGVWTVETCGCEECRQELGDRIEAAVEQGEIIAGEALEEHARAGTL